MQSVKSYMHKSVWVSEELAERLVNEGYAEADYGYKTVKHTKIVRSYEWKLDLGFVFLRSNCLTTSEDDLAMQLMLLQTNELRLEYLNAN